MPSTNPKIPHGFDRWSEDAMHVYQTIQVQVEARRYAGAAGDVLTLSYRSEDPKDRSNTSSLAAAFFMNENEPGKLSVLNIEAEPLLRGRGLYPVVVQRAINEAIHLRPKSFFDKSGNVSGVLVGEILSQGAYTQRQRISPTTRFNHVPNIDPIALTDLSDLVGGPQKPPPISSLSARARSGNLYSDLRDGYVANGIEAFAKVAKALRPTLVDPAYADDRLQRPDLFRRERDESHYAYAVRFLHPEVRARVGPAGSYAVLDALATHIGLPLSPEAFEKRLLDLDRAPSKNLAMPLMLLGSALETAAANPHRPQVRIDAYLKAAETFRVPEMRSLLAPSPPLDHSPDRETYRRIGNAPAGQVILVEREHFENVARTLTEQSISSGGARSFVLIDAAATARLEKTLLESRPPAVLYLTPSNQAFQPEKAHARLTELSHITNRHGLALHLNDPRTGQYFQFTSGPARTPSASRPAPLEPSR